LTEEQYIEFAGNVRAAQKESAGKTSRIIGAHFEGPFINPEGKGGMDGDYLRPMDLGECQRYIDKAGDVLRLMTLSPELKGGEEVISLLRRHDVVVSLGHSRATAQELERAKKVGLNHVCHLFNTFEKTELIDGWQWTPGLLENILISESLNCEVICDMFHVLAEYVKLAAKMLGPYRFVAMTDSMRGTGLIKGEYKMTDGRVFTTDGPVARLVEDGTVVGSILTMNRAFGNLVEKCSISLTDAARFTSTNAAMAMGIGSETGSVEVGKRADLAVLDSDYNCVATFLSGELVYDANND